jgi:hypothetical protein
MNMRLLGLLLGAVCGVLAVLMCRHEGVAGWAGSPGLPPSGGHGGRTARRVSLVLGGALWLLWVLLACCGGGCGGLSVLQQVGPVRVGWRVDLWVQRNGGTNDWR